MTFSWLRKSNNPIKKINENQGQINSKNGIWQENLKSLYNSYSMQKEEKQKTHFTPDELQTYLNTNRETGLTSEEALKRQQKFGLNLLVEQKKENFFISFIKAILFEPMSLLLFIVGMIGLALAIYEHVERSPHFILSYVQTGFLLSIVIINAFFGTIQERKSSNAINELAKIASPTAKVLRDGKIIQIKSEEITIGDILIVEAGDTVNADATLFFDSHLKISEAVLTGESMEVLKDADFQADPNSPLGDQKNRIFSGTNVLNGKGYAVVTGISHQTELGKVADLLNDRDAVISPLQLKLQKLGKVLGLVGMAITLLTFIFSLLVIENVFSPDAKLIVAIQSSLLLAISLAAAAIPEGLAAITTIVLALGVKKMAAKQALVKKLPSVETLGSTGIICSDKTGTLTLNKMTLVKLVAATDLNHDRLDLETLSAAQKDVLIKASLCTDAVIDENPQEELKKAPLGDPTEIAILKYALKAHFSVLDLKYQNQRLHEIPFDSQRKLMSTINEINGKKMLIVKGAPDVVFGQCKNLDVNQIQTLTDQWSDQAIRVLALAQKEITTDLPEDLVASDYEFDLEFIGLVGMIDPPREEVKVSIKECIASGIKPIMITGDHLNTAVAIAKELGIVKSNKDLAITGVQLDQMSDEELTAKIENYSVYARVSPANKIRIVKAWQAKDQVVAMTGDGVNDAPALKAADIGCAMGITGTDVAKQASDMILMDDNFNTIVEAVKLGRNIYEGIRRICKFLLSSNLTGIFAVVIGMFIFYTTFQVAGWGAITADDLKTIGTIAWTDQMAQQIANRLNQDVKFTTTVTTIQILVNHMIFETFPGIALGAQMSISDFMKRRPRSKYESIFADRLIWQILATGLIHGTLTIISFTIGAQIAISQGAPLLRFYYGSVAAFVTLTIGGILKTISMSSAEVVWKIKWQESKWIFLTCLFSFFLTSLVIFIPQLSAITAEYPELNFADYQKLGLTNPNELNNIIERLSNHQGPNQLADWKIYLICGSFGILTFIGLECYKIIELKFFKAKKIKPITDFELILRPLNWKQKMAKKSAR